MSHTLEPWTVKKTGHSALEDSIWIDSPTLLKPALAFREADANLIAAAPELLEALKAFVDMPIINEKEAYIAITNAKIAIAKAESK